VKDEAARIYNIRKRERILSKRIIEKKLSIEVSFPGEDYGNYDFVKYFCQLS